jgi:cytochrome c553
MGYSPDEPYTWVETDTYQLLNHGISPSSSVLQCSSCHESTSRIDLQGELGYQLKGAKEVVCVQCHNNKEAKPFTTIHDKHVKDKGYDCSWCHGFSRPERSLRMP